MREYDITVLEQRKRLIDAFVNAIFVYNDRLLFTFNYKRDAKTVLFSDLKSSDISKGVRPVRRFITNLLIFFILRAFSGFFAVYSGLHRLENVRYFFAQNRLKIGYDHMFYHICHEKAIFHKGFRHFEIFTLCKMTAVLCFENRRFMFSVGFFFVYSVSNSAI